MTLTSHIGTHCTTIGNFIQFHCHLISSCQWVHTRPDTTQHNYRAFHFSSKLQCMHCSGFANPNLSLTTKFLAASDPVHTGPDPYGHHINVKSLKTSMTLKFVIILQNLIKACRRKSGKSKYDRKLTELDVKTTRIRFRVNGVLNCKNMIKNLPEMFATAMSICNEFTELASPCTVKQYQNSLTQRYRISCRRKEVAVHLKRQKKTRENLFEPTTKCNKRSATNLFYLANFHVLSLFLFELFLCILAELFNELIET